jgi:hypothetical protein
MFLFIYFNWPRCMLNAYHIIPIVTIPSTFIYSFIYYYGRDSSSYLLLLPLALLLLLLLLLLLYCSLCMPF